MKILVAGGAGFIGSHTCITLLENGYEIVIVDNYSNSSQEMIPLIEEISGKSLKAYECDLLDKDKLSTVFKENSIDAVIHFAALKAVAVSVGMPLQYYHNNITGTLNLLSVMNEYGVKQLVFSSSATVYGMNNPVPFVETMPTSAINPYGWTKVMIEQICKDACVADPELRIAMLRYFNPIGAHKSGKIGENPNGIPNNLMPIIMDVARGKLPALKITGNDYDTKDGTGVRDYIHICDLAEGHLKALERLQQVKGAHVFNLGTGKGFSVLEVLAGAERAVGRKLPTEIAPRRPGDIAECYADVEKSKAELGFVTSRGLDEMCCDAWNYIKNKEGIQ